MKSVIFHKQGYNTLCGGVVGDELEGLSCEAGCDEDAVVSWVVDGLSVDEVWHIRGVIEFGDGDSVVDVVCIKEECGGRGCGV